MIDAAPIDRIHFLDEQRRNRRTGWVTAVLVALALMASGIPLSVLVSPALIAVALIFTYIADVFSTVPASVWQSLHDVVYILPETWRAIRSESVDIPWRTLGMLLVVPGTAVIFLIWAFVAVAGWFSPLIAPADSAAAVAPSHAHPHSSPQLAPAAARSPEYRQQTNPAPVVPRSC